jgi:hypothetical protein
MEDFFKELPTWLEMQNPSQIELSQQEAVQILSHKDIEKLGSCLEEKFSHLLDEIQKKCKNKDWTSLILFSFDEAACLTKVEKTRASKDPFFGLNMFRHLVFALSCLPEASSCFCLVTDTWSRLTNFLPSKDYGNSDNSLRFLDSKAKPFPPYWTFKWGQKEDDENIHNMYVSTGRPLWRTLLDVLGNLEKVMDTVAVKLLALKDKDSKVSWNRYNVAALYGCILALHFHNNRQLAEEVVRSHMGTVYSISNDREFVCWGYPSEPILPASILYARKYWLKDYQYEKQIDELLKITQSGNHFEY